MKASRAIINIHAIGLHIYSLTKRNESGKVHFTSPKICEKYTCIDKKCDKLFFQGSSSLLLLLACYEREMLLNEMSWHNLIGPISENWSFVSINVTYLESMAYVVPGQHNWKANVSISGWKIAIGSPKSKDLSYPAVESSNQVLSPSS